MSAKQNKSDEQTRGEAKEAAAAAAAKTAAKAKASDADAEENSTWTYKLEPIDLSAFLELEQTVASLDAQIEPDAQAKADAGAEAAEQI